MAGKANNKTWVAERTLLMSNALVEVARRARFSTRSRKRFDAGGFGARRGARAIRIFGGLTFFILVLLPTTAGTLYYSLYASDQYVAEAQFTVVGGEIHAGSGDAFSAATGIPAMAIIQDTQIVTAYLESRAAVEALSERVNLRELYGRDSIDWFARLDREGPIERLVRYWREKTKIAIQMPSGIVEFKVRAFQPTDAQLIAQTVVDISERLINDLNARIQNDAVANSEAELKRASKRLGDARARLELARNEEGVLDAGRAAAALEKLLTEVRSVSLTMQQDYQARLRSVAENAPQMRALRSQIDASRAQISELESKLTATRSSKEKSLSASMTTFSVLDLERQIAERIYTSATATLELARLASEHRLMYLKTFVWPVKPEEPQYPKRILYSLFILGSGLALWGALIGITLLARNNMA